MGKKIIFDMEKDSQKGTLLLNYFASMLIAHFLREKGLVIHGRLLSETDSKSCCKEIRTILRLKCRAITSSTVSRSSQCSTTGATKAVVCVILSVG